MPFDAQFDATAVAPIKMGAAHPVGNKFPFKITNTRVEKVKDKEAGRFEVEFTSPQGSIKKNYNLWNDSEAARRFAQGEFSWLCHCVGIFKVDFRNDGAALRGGIGLMDVNFQKGQEPSSERPQGGYVEVSNTYDKNGNEPNQQNTSQQQASSGFTNQQPQQQQSQSNVQSGWNANGGQQASQGQQTTQSNNGGGWNSQLQQQQLDTNAGGGWQQQLDTNAGGGWQQQGNMPSQAPWQK